MLFFIYLVVLIGSWTIRNPACEFRYALFAAFAVLFPVLRGPRGKKKAVLASPCISNENVMSQWNSAGPSRAHAAL